MNFAEIIYRLALFTIVFFIFNKLFSRYLFKNREEVSTSFGQFLRTFFLYFIVGATGNFLVEKYIASTVIDVSGQQLSSGQSAAAPTMQFEAKPLKLDIAFSNDVHEEDLTVVKTDLAEYIFSTRGATLQAMTLLWKNNQRVAMLGKGDQFFTLAFNEVTPIAYKLINSQSVQNGNAHELVYRAKYGHGNIEKKFVIYGNSYQIDIAVSCENIAKDEQVRLLVPAPLMTDELQAVVNVPTVANSLKIQNIALNKPANLTQFWFEPKLFGFTSKFFTNVCFASNLQANGRVYLKEFENKTFGALFESKSCNGDIDLSWSFYFGPKSVQDLKKVSPALSVLVDYGMLSFLAKPLANALNFIQEKTGSYGWAIVLITLILKLLMAPFTLRSERGMREQAEFEKKRQHLQQKFKHDKAALDKATAELIQKHGLPIFSGCLPMLLNIPVFISLNKVLTSSTELYGASFLWLPDLSAADPYYILSVATFVGMIFAPGMQTTQGPRQMFSKVGFALFLAAVTSYLSSGLALFVVLNTLFGVVQSFLIKKIRWLTARYA